MRQLHVVHDIAVRSGGLGLAALRYAQAVAEAGAAVTLFVAVRTTDELTHSDNYERFRVVGAAAEGLGGLNASLLHQAMALRRLLNSRQFDVVHLHGTWSPILALGAYFARAIKIPYVVSPHGCLEPWALNHRAQKKKLALTLYQRRIFEKSALLVATAGQELASIRRLGIKTPVAVVPNGVDLPAGTVAKLSDGVRRVLFLSRIHPKKGLADLVLAWGQVRQPGWQVVIAGPDEGGYEAVIRGLIKRHGLEADFDFPGVVAGERKERLFAEADIFILPTYSENFGIAVAEALARAVPVITTTGAPWQELETCECGWWVAPGVNGVAVALAQAMRASADTLAEMGARGRSLVEAKYAWARIGKEALRASEWALHRTGSKPECIDLV